MQVYVMLTVDLNRGVSEDVRLKFNEYLQKQHWVKLKLTTTWYGRFAEGVSRESAIEETKGDVRNAAKHAGISYYEGAAEAGHEAPAVWNQSLSG